MKSDLFYWRALMAVIAITALFAFVFGKQQKSQGDVKSASSFNPAPSGNKALFVTLQETGWPVGRWQTGLDELSGRDQVLVLTRNHLGHWYDLQKAEAEHLFSWVEAGNEVILLGDFDDTPDTRFFLEKLHFTLPKELTAGERLYEQSREAMLTERPAVRLHIPAESAHPLSTPVSPATVSAQTKKSAGKKANGIVSTPVESVAVAPAELIIEKSKPLPALPPGAEALWQDDYFPIVAKIPLGRGSVVWCRSASLIDNEFLRRADNLPWFLSLLQPRQGTPGAIWFEEGHHGYRKRYALADLMKDPGLRLAGLQAAMGLLLFLTSQLTRFGSTIPLERESGRSGMEFVESMARLYRHANLRNEVVRTLYEETRLRIAQKFNLPPRATDEALDQRLRDAFPHLPSWKDLVRRFNFIFTKEQSMSPRGWLGISRDLIHIKREMI